MHEGQFWGAGFGVRAAAFPETHAWINAGHATYGHNTRMAMQALCSSLEVIWHSTHAARCWVQSRIVSESSVEGG